jgi:coproporphyrinogen III oxidase-like Fe-S oxidoreductase
VLSIKTCLEGGNLVHLTIHAPWCITRCPFNIFYQTTCKGQAWGAAKALFCRNIIDSCEAREHGGDSKRKHQVEGAIMQAKEWTIMFGRCTRSRSNKVH